MITSGFRDAEAAQRALARLDAMAGFALDPMLASAFAQNPEPDRALRNLEQWLIATHNGQLFLHQMADAPTLSHHLVYLLGVSQPIADCLIQNPELASLVFEPSARAAPCTRDKVVDEGRRLLAVSSSYTHSLDRLRFLRQKWNLVIVLNDLEALWEQPLVWDGLSQLAEGLVQLCVEIVWEQRGEGGECPLGVVCFGKLAGRELNYSSDIDLVYVGASDSIDLTKLSGALTRALTDRMGRGSLYRVDLRLRPYGSAGSAVQSLSAMQAYYLRYAEPWEIQALARSRVIVGSAELTDAWEELRATYCFRPTLSEMALEQMLVMRDRIGDVAQGDDLKRGPGGIRDVEFLTQIMQLLHGFDHPAIRAKNTLSALAEIESAGLLDHAVVSGLSEGYVFLRTLEHRLQLADDQQTHAIPDDERRREAIASLMRYPSWASFTTELSRQRRTIHSLYRAVLNLEGREPNAAHEERAFVREALGSTSVSAIQWLDALPESDSYYRSLAESPEAIARLQTLLTFAPRLIGVFRSSVALGDLVLSGEIEGDDDPVDRMASLPVTATLRVVSETYVGCHTTLLTRWALDSGRELRDGLSLQLSRLLDEFLKHCRRRLHGEFDLVALGSLGSYETGPASDADLLLLVADAERQRSAELQAQQFLSLISELRRFGAPVAVDLRLRPDGGQGLLVRTYDGLRAYDLDGMEMWERFALGNARLLDGDPECLRIVQHSATGLPLTPERLRELAKMKRRIETERVLPQHQNRNIKLGPGGLSDIDWLVHLHEMRYPSALRAGETTDMTERIRRLGRVGLINAVEVEALLTGRLHLLDLRTRLYLLGIDGDLVPENPDRLTRLATWLGYADGNAFLAAHERLIGNVRSLYQEALERLRA